MLNGNDVLLLVRLAANPDPWTFRSLGDELQMDPAAVHRGVAHLKEAQLLDEDRQVNRANVEEFLVHALRFVLPARLGPVGRGVPTAWGRAPLRKQIAAGSEPSPVWPDPHGRVRGPVVAPVSDAAPKIAESDPELGQWLGLIDALRVGRARERKLAANELRRRIWSDAE
jgi:hypothetical protein